MTNIRFDLCCLFLEQPIKFRTDAHVAVQQEAESTKHLLLIHARSPNQPAANSFGENFTVGH